MDPYANYVIAAYGISFGGLGALLLWGIAGRRRARRLLQRAERSAERAGASIE